MPSLQVRELPEPIYRKLQESAQRDHRSLSQQAVVTLKKGLEIKDNLKGRRRKLINKVLARQVAFSTNRLDSPVKLIREDRQR